MNDPYVQNWACLPMTLMITADTTQEKESERFQNCKIKLNGTKSTHVLYMLRRKGSNQNYGTIILQSY